MELTLSTGDFARLERALTTLLSPLDAPTLDDWRETANQSVCDLIGGDRALFGLPNPHHSPILGSGIDEPAVEAYATYYAAQDVGMQRQQELGLQTWSVLMLLDSTEHRRTEIWNDWKAPNALWGATGITLEIEGLPAGLVCYDAVEEEGLEERQLALLSLLKPAFVAGVRTYLRLADRRTDLLRSMDVLRDAVGLYDLEGRLLHANPALLRLLEAEPQAPRLAQEMEAGARRLGRLASRCTKANGNGLPSSGIGELEIGGHYRLTGTFLGRGQLGPEQAVMITVATLRPPPPSAATLRERFGLTRRETTVAVLLVQGKTNEQIAAELNVSPHTARHHTENIFLKLHVHSRAELAERVPGARLKSAHLVHGGPHVRFPRIPRVGPRAAPRRRHADRPDMFGGYSLYLDGAIFALIDDDVVYFKVDDSNRADYEKAGMRPFAPMGDDRPMQYYEVPPDVLENRERLREWAERSAAISRKKARKRK